MKLLDQHIWFTLISMHFNGVCWQVLFPVYKKHLWFHVFISSKSNLNKTALHKNIKYVIFAYRVASALCTMLRGQSTTPKHGLTPASTSPVIEGGAAIAVSAPRYKSTQSWKWDCVSQAPPCRHVIKMMRSVTHCATCIDQS